MNAEIEPLTISRWRELAGGFKDYNYRQIWEYGTACAYRLGAVSEHIAFTSEGEVLGMTDVRIRRTPLFNAGIAYVNGGPLVRRDDPSDSLRLWACLEALIAEFVWDRNLVLRINAPIGSSEWNGTQAKIFSEIGFRPALAYRAYRTFILNLDRSEEELRKGFVHSWRTNLNRSEESDITLSIGTGLSLFEEFCDLYRQLITRKQFTADLDAVFYTRLQPQLTGREQFQVFIARIGNEPIAGYVTSFLGDTCTALLAATSQKGLEHRAAYRLQWAIIQEARRRKCSWYDLGGIDPENNPGVYRFKKGLGGHDVTAPGPFEIRPAGLKRYLVAGGERLYRLLKTSTVLSR